jgi:hypothetical protein
MWKRRLLRNLPWALRRSPLPALLGGFRLYITAWDIAAFDQSTVSNTELDEERENF